MDSGAGHAEASSAIPALATAAPDSRANIEKTRLMCEMARPPFESDSTRLITLFLDSAGSPAIELGEVAITEGYDNLSHHGKNESTLRRLEAIDKRHMKLFGDLLAKPGSMKEHRESLPDRTMVLPGSNFGDANEHTTSNMPVILAGGCFADGQHLGLDQARNYPLPNLYVSMLRRMGIEAEKFAPPAGTMRGLGTGG